MKQVEFDKLKILPHTTIVSPAAKQPTTMLSRKDKESLNFRNQIAKEVERMSRDEMIDFILCTGLLYNEQLGGSTGLSLVVPFEAEPHDYPIRLSFIIERLSEETVEVNPLIIELFLKKWQPVARALGLQNPRLDI